jgi:hypothetical protein
MSNEIEEETPEQSLLAILADVQILVEAVKRVREIADNLILNDTQVNGKAIGKAIIKTIETVGDE